VSGGHARFLPHTRLNRLRSPAFTAGPSLAWLPHRNVALWAGVDAVFPYLRPSFAVEGAGTLYSVPALGVRGLLGVELRLP
jgi:hypothetical protein